MTQVTVKQIDNGDGQLLIYVKPGATASCTVTVVETGSANLDPVWVHCDSTDFIRPDNATGTWPKRVDIVPGTHQGSFNVYGVKIGGGQQGVSVFLHGEKVCPNCVIYRRCVVLVQDAVIEGTGQAIPITLITPYPASRTLSLGDQAACVVEIQASSPSAGGTSIAVDVSDREAVVSPSGSWPYLLTLNDPNTLAATVMLTVAAVSPQSIVQVYAYNNLAFNPSVVSSPFYQLTAINVIGPDAAKPPAGKRKRASK